MWTLKFAKIYPVMDGGTHDRSHRFSSHRTVIFYFPEAMNWPCINSSKL